MTMFVWIVAGTATGVAGDAGWVQQVALTSGLCIMVLVYTIGHHSGGHINCAVTFGLVLAGKVGLGDLCSVPQGVANFVAQISGSIVGATLVALMKGTSSDKTGSLGCNMLALDIGIGEAVLGEILGAFLLMYVVLETAVNELSSNNRMLAPIAIGTAVYLAHSILIPVDGCSINPSRSFGTAVIASLLYADNGSKIMAIWKDHWIFWVGPLVGATLAVGVYRVTNTTARVKANSDKVNATE
eukprot:CAMPEP_0117538736 /NCGR_PEP_ID=MMETSP0784-20121206/42631_1 /TAXON_ID=39447 /ORGANISM="" /LENGTH=241 /DNA_ID=CAMNT_0005335357 /DNA_START=117 /DNA_END=842 /DNA_ORIENTATION=+